MIVLWTIPNKKQLCVLLYSEFALQTEQIVEISLPQWSPSWVLHHRPQRWECMNRSALCPTVPSQ